MDKAVWYNVDNFRKIFRDMHVGMLLVSPEGQFLAANPAICEFLGYTEIDLLNENVFSITHQDDLATTREIMRHSIEVSTNLPPVEKRYLHKDGQPRWGEVVVSVIRGTDGSPNCRIVQVSDISERKKSDESLRTNIASSANGD